MISVAGRRRRKWMASVEVVEGRLVVKIDDDDDDEFWIELVVDEEGTEGIVVEWCQCLRDTVIELGDSQPRQ